MTGAVAEWIKPVAFEAVKLSSQEVRDSVQAGKQSGRFFIQAQSTETVELVLSTRREV